MAVAEAPGLPVGECAHAVTVSISRDIECFEPEPRCRVCRSDHLSKQVNDMLARGASYAGIVRTLSLENAELDEHDRVTVHSVRNHADRHFPVQNAAKAVYREILERSARENAVDFVNGVATAVSPAAFFEAVMVRAWETLVDQNAAIDANMGMVAASKLQALVESRAGETSLAEIIVKMNRVIEAVRTTVPSRCGRRSGASSRATTSPPSRWRKRTTRLSSPTTTRSSLTTISTDKTNDRAGDGPRSWSGCIRVRCGFSLHRRPRRLESSWGQGGLRLKTATVRR